jgi:hypothetical protein
MKRLVILGIIVTIVAVVYSCKNDKYDKLYPASSTTTTCDTSGTISYSKDIMPIVQEYCYSPGNGCHDAAGSATSGYDYTTYQGIVSNAQNGLLLGDITWASGYNQMPKNGAKLSDCDIAKFAKWINEGAPNN